MFDLEDCVLSQRQDRNRSFVFPIKVKAQTSAWHSDQRKKERKESWGSGSVCLDEGKSTLTGNRKSGSSDS